jgi:hypothetical protein
VNRCEIHREIHGKTSPRSLLFIENSWKITGFCIEHAYGKAMFFHGEIDDKENRWKHHYP